MIKIHPEGTSIVVIAFITATMLVIIASWLFPLWIFLPFLLALAVVLLLIFRFFRIPRRTLLELPGHVIAPADGKIVAIETVKESEYFDDERILVSIFMSIYDVHINWYPVQGEVKYFKYHPGKYLVARHPKSSELNERTSIVIGNENNEIMVRQIAGYVARRIICYANPEREIEQSTEMGFIRFGSRLDVYLPVNAGINVNLGDKTYGGVTALAKLA